MLYLQKYPSTWKLKMESGSIKGKMKGMMYFFVSTDSCGAMTVKEQKNAIASGY